VGFILEISHVLVIIGFILEICSIFNRTNKLVSLEHSSRAQAVAQETKLS
jgi:hypothetical protein